MFNRHIVVLAIALTVVIGLLAWKWGHDPGVNFPIQTQVQNEERPSQVLNGNWIKFSSLRQAWVHKDRVLTGGTEENGLTDGRNVHVPSSEKLNVVARKFFVPPEWSARNVRLIAEGLTGQASIYLNGIESVHRVGTFEGVGGRDSILFPPSALMYGKENLLFFELEPGFIQKQRLFAFNSTDYGHITGGVWLEAVTETFIDKPNIKLAWDSDRANVDVTVELVHSSLDYSPWLVEGAILDSGLEVAKNSTEVKSSESASHQVTLTFSVPNARKWSISDPYLYQLRISATNSKGDKDQLLVPVGLKSLVSDKGNMILNGTNISINGLALAPEMADSLRSEGKVESWLKAQRAEGINLIYFIGQFPDKTWLDTADRIGMGVWVEWPVALIPATRLPNPQIFQHLTLEGNLHPSLWGWIVGKGLGGGSKVNKYFVDSKTITGSIPTFMLSIKSLPTEPIAASNILQTSGNSVLGSWGQVRNYVFQTDDKTVWLGGQLAAKIYAAWMIILFSLNIRAASWRYKEISTKKPRRTLRSAWFWQGVFFISRMGTLAGVATLILMTIPSGIKPWLPDLWPAVEELQMQSPWLLWIGLTLLMGLFRILQVGVVAPYFPGSPHPVGLVYWFERRYRWSPVIAILWALVPYGIPLGLIISAYILLTIFFLPLRIRDVHRIGGVYRPLLIVPGIMSIFIAIWAVLKVDYLSFLLNSIDFNRVRLFFVSILEYIF
ncbi:MAG: glycosyl hydrolase [Desulfitobacterium hafniense]|nr:glycosyl hydrolase [Desulfitobacterium hafniense]